MKANLNMVANAVTDLEGGAQQVNLPQVKDVLAAYGTYLRSLSWRRRRAVEKAIRQRAGMHGAFERDGWLNCSNWY
jgi:hypothetical protein